MITWIARTPTLYEARLVTPDGRTNYVGYVATRSGDDAWRGYIGRAFASVGVGTRATMQDLIERWVLTVLAQLRGDGGGEDDMDGVRGDGMDHAS